VGYGFDNLEKVIPHPTSPVSGEELFGIWHFKPHLTILYHLNAKKATFKAA